MLNKITQGDSLELTKQLERNFIAFELDKDYVEKSTLRLESEGNQINFDW